MTSAARTLVDFAATASPRDLERALDQAEIQRLLPDGALEQTLCASVGRPGIGKLQTVLARLTEPTLTRSELEERFLALCDRSGVRRPRVNAWITLDGGGVEVDFLWPQLGLVVEVDGFAVHGTRRAFGHDRPRDRMLRRAGFRVERFTWSEVVHHAEATRVELIELTDGAGDTGSKRGAPHPRRG